MLGSTCAPWPITTDCSGLPENIDQATLDRSTAVASQILWSLSGRRYGPCPVVVRPCRRSCLNEPGLRTNWAGATGNWIPYADSNGVWRNASVCGCSSDCSCGELCEVHLPGPVYDIEQVLIDGAILDPDSYRVDVPGKLVRTDGDCWPYCQDMAAASTEEGTFEVTYNVGLPLDAAALAAVSEMTAELVKSCIPNCECKLPKRVTQINRAGMVAQFIDPQTFLENGKTGLYMVDLWLMSVNPNKLTQPSRVMSPDSRPPRQMT